MAFRYAIVVNVSVSNLLPDITDVTVQNANLIRIAINFARVCFGFISPFTLVRVTGKDEIDFDLIYCEAIRVEIIIRGLFEK